MNLFTESNMSAEEFARHYDGCLAKVEANYDQGFDESLRKHLTERKMENNPKLVADLKADMMQKSRPKIEAEASKMCAGVTAAVLKERERICSVIEMCKTAMPTDSNKAHDLAHKFISNESTVEQAAAQLDGVPINKTGILAEWNAAVAEKMNAGMPMHAAISAVVAERPALRAALVIAANKK